MHDLAGIDNKHIFVNFVYPLFALNRRASNITVKNNGNYKVFAGFTCINSKILFGQSQPCQFTFRPIKPLKPKPCGFNHKPWARSPWP